MTDTIIVTPRPPATITVSPSPGTETATSTIKVDGSRIGPAGPSLPITFVRRGPVIVLPEGLKYRFPFPARLIGYSAALGSAPVGGPITVDICVNHEVVATLTVPDGAEDVPEIAFQKPVAVGDFVTVAITAVGPTQPGSDLSIFIRYA